MKRYVTVGCLSALVVAVVGTAAVCGSGTPTPGAPTATPTTIPFIFTPVPYTNVPEGDGTVLPLSLPPGTTADNCAPYIADQVGATVDSEHLNAFINWARGYGFTVDVLPPQAVDIPSNVTVHVPLGSAVDALSLVRSQPGVIAADIYSLMGYPEAPPPPICPTRAPGP